MDLSGGDGCRTERQILNDDRSNVRSSRNIFRLIKSGVIWSGHLAFVGDVRSVWTILVGKPDGKRFFGDIR